MSKILNKKVLTDCIAEQCGLTKKKSEEIVNAVFEEMKSTLIEEGSIDIYGFGKIELGYREAREGINPLTKEKMTVAASKTIKFKAYKSLKDAVNHR